MIEEKKCKNCGAPLRNVGYNRYKCEYCGSIYEENTHHVFIEVERPQCFTIRATASVPEYIVRKEPDIASKCVVDQLAQSLAEKIKEHMTIYQNYDICNMDYIYEGQIRILPKSYKYGY